MIRKLKIPFVISIGITVLFILALPAYSAIYGLVTGKVVDGNGDPVSGVTVRIISDEGRNPDREATSNRRGVYRITNVNTGNYEIAAEKDGYIHRNQISFRVSASSRINLDVYMDTVPSYDDADESVEYSRDE